jgi:ankyrin repeat protein
MLLKFFAEVNATDNDGVCPLHLACMSGNLAVVDALLSRKELIFDLQEVSGDIPMHKASNALAYEIIVKMVERDLGEQRQVSWVAQESGGLH